MSNLKVFFQRTLPRTLLEILSPIPFPFQNQYRIDTKSRISLKTSARITLDRDYLKFSPRIFTVAYLVQFKDPSRFSRSVDLHNESDNAICSRIFPVHRLKHSFSDYSRHYFGYHRDKFYNGSCKNSSRSFLGYHQTFLVFYSEILFVAISKNFIRNL